MTAADKEKQAAKLADHTHQIRDGEGVPVAMMRTATLGTLSRYTADPGDNVRGWMVRGVFREGAANMLVGPAKAGKTTMVGNLARSLWDGSPFLSTFETAKSDVEDEWIRPGDLEDAPFKVWDGQEKEFTPFFTDIYAPVIVSLEMPSDQVAGWYRQMGVNSSAVILGREAATAWNVTDARHRKQIVSVLREYTHNSYGITGENLLIVDPFSRLLDIADIDENSNEVGKIWGGLLAIVERAGLGSLLVVHHTGYEGERGRGHSRLLGMPDAIWTLKVKGGMDSKAQRSFKAYGRDVDVPEFKLAYDRDSRTFTAADAEEVEKPAVRDVDLLIEAVRTEPGIKTGPLRERTGMNGVRYQAAMKLAGDQVYTATGPKNAQLHYLAKQDQE